MLKFHAFLKYIFTPKNIKTNFQQQKISTINSSEHYIQCLDWKCKKEKENVHKQIKIWASEMTKII